MVYRPKSRIWTPAALSAAAVPLQDIKDHLRVTHDMEDALIASYAMAATAAIERATQRLLQVRQAILYLPALPTLQEPIELPGGAVSSVTSVAVNGTPVTGAMAYGDSPAVLVPSTDWPVAVGQGYPVIITYQVGYSAIPQNLVQAVKLTAGHWYEQRGVMVDMRISEVPMAVEYLVAQMRIHPAS